MKVLLVQPTPPAQHFPQGAFRTMHVPTGLAYVAAAVKRAGHEVRVHIREEQLYKHRLDWDATNAHFRELLQSYRPDLVGFSVLTPSVEETAKMARLVKELGRAETKVVVGGVHPTAMGQEMLASIPEIDVVVLCEGEETLVELANDRRLAEVAGILYREGGQVCATPPRAPLHNLDALAPIDYDMFDMAYFTAPSRWLIRWLKIAATNIRTSRGCSNACQFCAGHLVAGLGVRYHSVESVIEQIQTVVDRYQLRGIHFEDDTLGADPDRLVRLCEALRRRGLAKKICWDGCLRVDQAAPELLAEMKSAGCIQIEYGFEAASDKTLSRLGKKATVALNRRAVEITRQAGLRIYADIMIGLPAETAADVNATREFIRWAAPDVLSFGMLAVLPGTPLYRQLPAEEKSKLDFSTYAYMEGAQGTNLTAMSREEFKRVEREFVRYFVRPTVKRQLLNDTPADDHAERRQLAKDLRRFALRHPIRYWRLPGGARGLSRNTHDLPPRAVQ